MFDEETINKEVIYDGRILTLEKHQVRLANGKTSIREIIRHDGAVAVMAFTDDGKMLFVRQYRKAIDQTCVEIPAGLIDPDEDSLLAAKRELEEETTYQAEKWQEITRFYISPGYNDEYVIIYRADQLTKLNQDLGLDDDEYLEYFSLTYQEAQDLVTQGQINDAKTIYALLYWRLALEKGMK